MGNQLVDRVNELRCLGVKMDMNMELTFIPRMEYITNKTKAVCAFECTFTDT